MKALSILIIALLSQAVYGQGSYTLDDLLAHLSGTSRQVELASTLRQQQGHRYQAYQAQKRPQLRLELDLPNYSKTSTPVIQPSGAIAFQSIRQANSSLSLSASQAITKTGGTLFAQSNLRRFDNLSSDATQYNGVPVRVGIMQPILGYNRWKHQDGIQELALQEAELSYRADIEGLMAQGVARYFDVVAAAQDLDIAQSNEASNQRLQQITEERFNLGRASKDEKLQMQIEVNNASLQVATAQMALDGAVQRLEAFANLELAQSTSFPLPGLLDVGLLDLDLLLSQAQQHRPETLTYQRRMAQQADQAAQVHNDLGLQANLTASYGLARGSELLGDVYSDPFDEQFVNINVSLPILDWGRKRESLKVLALEKEAITKAYELDQANIESNIRILAQQIPQLSENVALRQDIMQAAQERYDIANQRYVLGTMDITYLSLAQRENDQARRAYTDALRQLWTTYYQLRLWTGYDIAEQRKITY